MARVFVVPRKLSGSVEVVTSVSLVNPATGEVVVELAEHDTKPGAWYSNEVPEGNWTLKVNDYVEEHPYFQEMPFRNLENLGHSHSTGVEASVVEAAYDTTAELVVGLERRYTLTARAAYQTGTLDVYLNGVLLPEGGVFAGSMPYFRELEPEAGTFYLYSVEPLAGQSTKGAYNLLQVRFQKPTT